MSYSIAVGRVGQIETQIASLGSAFAPPSVTSTKPSSSVPGSAAPTGSFQSALSMAVGSGAGTSALPTSGSSGASLPVGAGGGVALGAALPPGALSQLTGGQQQFAARLAADTGLDPGVVSAWVLAEESGGAASSRASAGNNDWLNIGYTDSGTYGAADTVWSDPVAAADATAGWLKGQNTIPGYGTASTGIQAILATAGRPPGDQLSAIQGSGWASSGYPSLPGLYTQLL